MFILVIDLSRNIFILCECLEVMALLITIECIVLIPLGQRLLHGLPTSLDGFSLISNAFQHGDLA